MYYIECSILKQYEDSLKTMKNIIFIKKCNHESSNKQTDEY